MTSTIPTPTVATPEVLAVPLGTLLAESWTPVADGAGGVVVLTDRPDLAAVSRRARDLLPGLGVRTVPAGAAEVDDALLESRSTDLDAAITDGFPTSQPGASAKFGVVAWQVRTLVVLVAAAAALVLAGYGEWLLAAATAVITATTALTTAAVWAWMRRGSGPADPPVTDDELPTYTILVPAYREEAVIGNMIHNLERLDYPQHLLDVIILVERHDPATETAVLAAGPPPFVRIVRIPPGTLQTKPRTCNLGLGFARGDLLVVFDAEDRPEPDQLRKAAARFRAGGPDLACVQARLLVRNGRHNPVTRWFELEYALRWNLVKPGLVRLGLPIPLGGTSNHFRTASLRAVGGWDAWNVTEDADLGMRCAATGRRIDMIDSVTWEESVTGLGAWVRQRTRWHKGSLITTMVHTRTPVQTWRRFGPRGTLVLLGLVLGNVVAALAQPFTFWLPILLVTGVFDTRFPALTAGVFALSMANVAVLAALHLIAGVAAGVRRPWYALLVLHVCSFAQTWAAARAVVHAVRSPFTWDKTPHTGDA